MYFYIIKFVNNERYVFVLHNELKTILIDKSEK